MAKVLAEMQPGMAGTVIQEIAVIWGIVLGLENESAKKAVIAERKRKDSGRL